MNTFIVFMSITILSMILTHFVQIHGTMNKLIIENLSLLDKMHEGLIVLSEKERAIQFASNPAIFLLKQKNTTTES